LEKEQYLAEEEELDKELNDIRGLLLLESSNRVAAKTEQENGEKVVLLRVLFAHRTTSIFILKDHQFNWDCLLSLNAISKNYRNRFCVNLLHFGSARVFDSFIYYSNYYTFILIKSICFSYFPTFS